jgi:pimeloyl-ACP methyl ester carboxylesterase
MRSGYICTTDGVRLHYVEAGEGPDLLLVAGWTLTADLWQAQITEFSRTHHVVAYDHRGHGISDSPGFGYRVSRLAADARDLILALGLTDITWVGHAMGCAVAWAYWDLYGGADLGRLVLIDEPPALMSAPDWPEDAARELGAIKDAAWFAQFTAAVRGPQATAVAVEALGQVLSPGIAESAKELVLERSLLMEREAASILMFNHAVQDWRDVLPRITVPVLVIGSETSVFPAAAMRDLAANIKDSAVAIIMGTQGGGHMAFFEDPEIINAIIRAFLSQH